jgi:hypothetical protein
VTSRVCFCQYFRINTPPKSEAKIDFSHSNDLARRALEMALARAASDAERAAIERLLALREKLQREREVHDELMIARRHARGAFFSRMERWACWRRMDCRISARRCSRRRPAQNAGARQPTSSLCEVSAAREGQ